VEAVPKNEMIVLSLGMMFIFTERLLEQPALEVDLF
jgi:hypothetical protein